MDHYETINIEEPIAYIPILNILMDPHIEEAVNKANVKLPEGFIRDPDPTGFKLNKMQFVLSAMKNGIPLPPISVKIYDTINDKTYYSIIDGRHRFASSIILGYSLIPAVIYI